MECLTSAHISLEVTLPHPAGEAGKCSLVVDPKREMDLVNRQIVNWLSPTHSQSCCCHPNTALVTQ